MLIQFTDLPERIQQEIKNLILFWDGKIDDYRIKKPFNPSAFISKKG